VVLTRDVDSRAHGLTELGDTDAVELCAILYGLFATGHCFRNRLQRHALSGEQFQLLKLFGGPGLAVPFKSLSHNSLFQRAENLRTDQ